MRRVLLLFTLTAVLSPAARAFAQPPGQTNANAERARAHYISAWQHMRAEHFNEAASEFQSAIDLNEKFELAYYGLGRAYLALHRYSEAVTSLSTCRDLYSAESSAKFNGQMDAQRYRQDRLMELQDLRNQYTKGGQANSQQTANMLQLIDNQIRLTTDANNRGLNVAIEEPVPSFVSLSLGSAYFRSERFVEAEAAYKEATKADDKAGEAHNNLAVIYLMKAAYPQALAEVKLAEKAGFRVNPELKDEIKQKMGQD
jgi:tetratricopeptide (TPR) repeat protein